MSDNQTMMQYFEWYLPDDGLWWKRCAAKAPNLSDLGITRVWLPPAYKATSRDDVGYGVYDMYDLGEFDQKGTVRTKYGTKDEYLEAVKAFHESGIQVFADIVLNHRMGGDEVETVTAVTDSASDRNVQVGGEEKIKVWSKFLFPGRKGKYSNFTWNHTHFTGTDATATDVSPDMVYRFKGKEWDRDTDPEFGNFDYLMGMNVDMDNPQVVKETEKWMKWYIGLTGIDGLRLDAVKHISFQFYRDFLKDIRKSTGLELPAVGEYWSGDVGRLVYYLETVEYSMSLFDVCLHYNFYNAAREGGNYDMRHILEGTLTAQCPDNAVTFVDNHDTQYGQSLQSPIEDWFKPLAYAMILLRKEGIPCVFYSDYYGNPVRSRPMVPNLGKLIKLRKTCAYGEQTDYMDNDHVIGWTRSGDREHADSGMAVVLSNAEGGKLSMMMGKENAGTVFYDALGNCPEETVVGDDGFAAFRTEGGNVSVWVRKKPFEELVINE